MSSSLRASMWRLGGGAVLAAAGLAVAVFLLPDASQKRSQTERAVEEAKTAADRQKLALEAARAQAERLQADRKVLDDLLNNMPSEGVGKLHWVLSQRLFELARKHGVRLVSVKYGAPAKEGTKGSNLESVDVEFSALAIFKDLKAFMLALESSKLPFAVVNAKLEEAPEGAHLTITLRAFRQSNVSPDHDGEGA
jgi:hypothetical protein